MYVCVCNSVTDQQIREAAGRGARCLSDLSDELAVATSCGKCADCARRILNETIADDFWAATPSLIPAGA